MEPPSGESPDDKEILEMGKPIERGKEKYVFNGENYFRITAMKFYEIFYLVFMRRVCGPEKYYLFDNAKSLRENLEGKGMVQMIERLHDFV